MLNIIRELKLNRTEMKIFAKLSNATQDWLRATAHDRYLLLNDDMEWICSACKIRESYVYSLPDNTEEPVIDLLIEALENLLDDCLNEESENSGIYDESFPVIIAARNALKQARKQV